MTCSLVSAGLLRVGEDGEDLVRRRWRVSVLSGNSKGEEIEQDGGRIIVGTHPTSDLLLEDNTVSRRHAELCLRLDGVLVRDLGSKNGVYVGGMRVEQAFITAGGTFQLGATEIRVRPLDEPPLPIRGTVESFGDFITAVPELAQLLAILDRVASSSSTVLIEGETGTGKEVIARALHDGSPRKDGPFSVVDCASLSGGLIESELFGHVKGSFTGAIQDREGIFESGEGGTVFLDELGELPLQFQPKLLRVLESRVIRRIGAANTKPLDVRLIAATNRNLDEMVENGTFRSDLLYRLAVVRARIPPLRERSEDITLIGRRFAAHFGCCLSDEAVQTLQHYDWPGNVREMRNVIERAAMLAEGGPILPGHLFPGLIPLEMSNYHEARERVTAEFESRYVEALLRRHPSNLSAAAREAGLSRPSLYELLKRAGRR